MYQKVWCTCRVNVLLNFLTFSVAVIGKDLCFKAKIHRGRTLYQFILEVRSNIRRYCRFNSAASMQAATILVVVVFQMQHDGKTWPTFICLIQKLPRKIKLFPHVNFTEMDRCNRQSIMKLVVDQRRCLRPRSHVSGYSQIRDIKIYRFRRHVALLKYG